MAVCHQLDWSVKHWMERWRANMSATILLLKFLKWQMFFLGFFEQKKCFLLVYEAIVSGCLSIVRDDFNVSLHMLNIMHGLFVTSIDLQQYITLTQFSPCTEKCDCWGLWAPFPVQRLQHPQPSPQWVWDYWDVGWTKSVKQTGHNNLSPHAVVHPVMKTWKQFFVKPSVILAALYLCLLLFSFLLHLDQFL